LAIRFQFVLYVSFVNEPSSIGLNLCRALHDFCEKNNLTDFKLVVRLSEKDKTRWSEEFIRTELAKYKQEDLKRIWACGPPPMSETFDKAFTSIATDQF
jgi:NAD(P)H-flavin reductase